MGKTANMLTDAARPGYAELLGMPVTHVAKHAEELIARQYVRNIYLSLVTSRIDRHMYVTHAGTDGIVTKTNTSIRLSMLTLQSAGEDPRAGRVSA